MYSAAFAVYYLQVGPSKSFKICDFFDPTRIWYPFLSLYITWLVYSHFIILLSYFYHLLSYFYHLLSFYYIVIILLYYYYHHFIILLIALLYC